MNKPSVSNMPEPTIYYECLPHCVLKWVSYRFWYQRLRPIAQQSKSDLSLMHF